MQKALGINPTRYKILERELRHDILEISRAYDSDEDKLFNFFELGGVLDLNRYNSL